MSLAMQKVVIMAEYSAVKPTPSQVVFSLRSKRFRLVSGQRNTEEGDFRFDRVRNKKRAKK